MGPNSSKEKRKKKNKSKREQLEARSKHFYRRKQGLSIDEDEVDLASYIRRTVQYLIDVFIVTFVALVFLALLEAIVGTSQFPAIVPILPQLIIGFFYFVPYYKKTGQTFGCKVMKIVVIKSDGTGYLNSLSSTMRWFSLYLLPNLYVFLLSQDQTFSEQLAISFIGIVMIFIIISPVFLTQKRQGLHDRFAKSIVVREW